jgi:hypothetical protein
MFFAVTVAAAASSFVSRTTHWGKLREEKNRAI